MASSRLLFIVGVFAALSELVSAHFAMVYPAWRGNTLKDDQQWIYPCAGMPQGQNRTLWPTTGGAIIIQPGFNAGHPTALMYANMLLGNNVSDHLPFNNIMIPLFQEVGPSKDPYPGTMCFPHVNPPASLIDQIKPGVNATIQYIQVALHGASLYNCADITFADPQDVEAVGPDRCFNSSDISTALVYTTAPNNSASSLGGLSIGVLASLAAIHYLFNVLTR